jgi:tetratricopeptide (TPR) repeat protein
VIPATPTLVDPKRSAHATLRGFLYQACLGVVRWLDLVDGEALLCEGDEDLDQLLRDGTLCEQVKHYSGRLGIADQAVVESLRQFLRSYVIHRRLDETRRFLFTTTATQRRSRKGGLDFDLLAAWQNGDRGPAVCTAVRALLVEDEDVPAWLADPVADLDAGQGWPGFLDAVEWHFGAPDLDRLRADILGKLAAFPAIPADLFRDRLVEAVLAASAQREVKDRLLTREDLTRLVDQARTELAEWAKSPAAVRLRKVFDELSEIGKLLHDNTADLPANPSPGKLLTADYEVIPFEEEGRRGELDILEAWRHRDEPRSVLLLTGDGGTGKTRLAIEWCRRLRHQGWHAGFLRRDRTEKDLDPLLEGVAPRLIVIDYAETRLAVVQPLLYKMGIDPQGGGPHVRLLLLARRAGDWWTGLTQGTAGREIEDLLAGSPQPHPVAPLVPAAEDRRKIYDTAVAAFAQELSRTVPNNPPVPDLEKKGFERVLYLHMAALAAVDGRSIGSAAEALDQTLNHERRFWRQQVEEMRLDGSLTKSVQAAFGQAVTALTLVGGTATEPQSKILLGRVLDGFPMRPDLAEAILDRLRQMYGGAGDGRYLDPLQPDILGEELVAEALQRDSRLLDKLLDGAAPEEGRGTLTVLTRLAQRRPEAEEWLRTAFRKRLDLLAESALDVAVEIGDPIGAALAREIEENANEDLAERLMDRCDEGRYVSSLPLREVGLAATTKKRDLFAARHPPRRGLFASLFRRWNQPPEAVSTEKARLANNLGNRLSDLGRLEEALKATKEAVDVYRELAGRRPDAFRPGLATSLNNLGNRLSDLGRHEEALKPTEEAMALRRDLAGRRPDAFLPDLAMSLNNLGNRLSDLGRREEALKAMEEAVAVYRDLDRRRPDAFLPDLAMSLNNLGTMLSDLGGHEEALKATEEAVSLRRELAVRRPDAFHSDLATSLNNLGTVLSDLGRREEALKATEEAVAVYRELAGRRPDAFLPHLATSLNNLGPMLSDLGRREEALKAAEEAVRILSPFFLLHPPAFVSRMKVMASNYLNRSLEAGQPDDDLLRPILEILAIEEESRLGMVRRPGGGATPEG